METGGIIITNIRHKSRLIKVFSICLILLSTFIITGLTFVIVYKKYVCNLYHYNVQFVPGDTISENNIINQSIRALIEMYERHPNWKFSIEISGIGLELMADRFPDVFSLFKKLNTETKQLELVLSPYSDMLSVAYPSIDTLKAINLSRTVAIGLNLTPSRVLFLQESQWLEDSFILDEFYDYYVVRNPFSYYYSDIEFNRVYSYVANNGKEIKVIPEESIPKIDFGDSIFFLYLGDGEAINTDSYANRFLLKEEQQQRYEHMLIQVEKLGFILETVEEAVKRSESRKITKVFNDFGPMPDSFWDMPSCIGAYRWMGDNSHPNTMPAIFFGTTTVVAENDGELIANNYRTRNFILKVETIYNNISYNLNAIEREWCQGNLTEAWKNQILAEVTDSTGWSPYWIEMEYALNHSRDANTYAQNALDLIKNKFGISNYNVSVYHQSVNSSDFELINKLSITAPSAIKIPIINYALNYTVEYKNCSWYGFSFQDITITIDISDIYQFNIVFDGLGKTIEYSSALGENASHSINRDTVLHDIILPGSNGFYYSPSLQLGIIKNCSRRHTAGFFNGDSLIFPEIGFIPIFTSNWSSTVITHQFFIYSGDKTNALILANMINSYPIGII